MSQVKSVSAAALETRVTRLNRRVDALEEMIAMMNGDASARRSIQRIKREINGLHEEMSEFAENLSEICQNQRQILAYLRHLTSSPYDDHDYDHAHEHEYEHKNEHDRETH